MQLQIQSLIADANTVLGGAAPVETFFILMETADNLLKEDTDNLLLE